MASPRQLRARRLTGGLLLLALFSMISFPGRGAIVPSVTSPSDSLLFTVNPDRSVGVGWNTTTILTIPQNISMLFPQGYAIQSSSSFSQQASAVVETTNLQYQLPPQIYTQVPYSLVDSISLTATQSGMSGQGSLTITTGLPVQTLSLVYSTTPTKIEANATAQVYFNPSFSDMPFANQTIFQTTWSKTFDNATWRNSIITQIENSTSHALTVTAFDEKITSIDSASASVSIGFVAGPSGSATDFVAAIENTLGTSIPSGLDSIIRSVLNLVTGESANVTYTGSTGKLVVQYATDYVSDLDTQLNNIKNQLFQFVMSSQPVGSISPSELFLNSTTITVSKISMTSNLDLNSGTSISTLSGLFIKPPTVGTSTNFTIPGLFQTLGSVPVTAPGVNITLAGGSDSSSQVKVIVPTGTPEPNSTTSDSATWTNVSNATELSNVRFVVQPLSSSFFALLLSPIGIAIEAIIAAAVIAGILLYARKRRTKTPVPLTPSGPAPAPGFGPSPAPPTQ